MVYTCRYESPLGGMLLAADEIGLTGLWFDGQKYFARELPVERTEKEMPILTETKRWLDIYFTGTEPDFLVYSITVMSQKIERSTSACSSSMLTASSEFSGSVVVFTA